MERAMSATGHTADDQVETVLFNILRGTGLAGLAGIPRVRPLGPAVSLIRPLLTIRRCEVISYLQEIEQDYCVDPSNASADFTRNRIATRTAAAGCGGNSTGYRRRTLADWSNWPAMRNA